MGWLCTGCGERHRDGFETCWKCGSSRDGAPEVPEREEDEEQILPQLRSEELTCEREAIRRRADEIKLEALRDGDYELSGGLLSRRGADFVRLRRGWQLRRERQARYHPAKESSSEGPRLDLLWNVALVTGVGSIAFWLLSVAAPPALLATLGDAPLWVIFGGGGGAFLLVMYLCGQEMELAKRHGYADSVIRD
jgi:hypothetical protein